MFRHKGLWLDVTLFSIQTWLPPWLLALFEMLSSFFFFEISVRRVRRKGMEETDCLGCFVYFIFNDSFHLFCSIFNSFSSIWFVGFLFQVWFFTVFKFKIICNAASRQGQGSC